MVDLILTSAACTIALVVGFFIWWLKDELSYQRREQAYNEAFYRIIIDRQLETINELKKKIEEIEDEIECFERKGQEYTIIEDVKLPNSKHSEDDKPIADATDSSQVEQPSHYIGEHGLEVREIEENFLVRFQDGHLAHLAGALLEYLLRAPSKGKLTEDIQKVQYLANEMAEYVEKAKEAR